MYKHTNTFTHTHSPFHTHTQTQSRVSTQEHGPTWDLKALNLPLHERLKRSVRDEEQRPWANRVLDLLQHFAVAQVPQRVDGLQRARKALEEDVKDGGAGIEREVVWERAQARCRGAGDAEVERLCVLREAGEEEVALVRV